MTAALELRATDEAGHSIPSRLGRLVVGRYVHRETLVMDTQEESDRLSVKVSDLRWLSDKQLRTRVKDVSVSFVDKAEQNTTQAVLEWIVSYRRSLQLNPSNTNAAKVFTLGGFPLHRSDSAELFHPDDGDNREILATCRNLQVCTLCPGHGFDPSSLLRVEP